MNTRALPDGKTLASPREGQRILVVDDAADTRLILNLRLQREGYTVSTAESGAAALEIIKREGLPDLVLLDIMMPDMDGFAVAAELHRMGDIPIIFLSALSDVDTKVEGLTLYAEDYVTKPFAVAELLARIRRILLRTGAGRGHEPELLIDDHLRINFAKQYATLDQQQVSLTPTENRILNILYNNRGRVLIARLPAGEGLGSPAQGQRRVAVGAYAPPAQQDRT